MTKKNIWIQALVGRKDKNQRIKSVCDLEL
jgi:hypothetical protein